MNDSGDVGGIMVQVALFDAAKTIPGGTMWNAKAIPARSNEALRLLKTGATVSAVIEPPFASSRGHR